MSRQKAHIVDTGIVLPYRVPIARHREMDAKMRRTHGVPESIILMSQALSKGSGIRSHHTVRPHWLPKNESSADYPDPTHRTPS
uniref:Uncharacterized protein n=1 Tax=Candidatus Kentrum sp. LFY TaxID=2126342 RepID=A0A450U9M4_9GAMM|nr:MAG: hypothetical protein BECKLFY1418B_GA0070995_101136 [Candidatus Kentron sp. LFY]